MNIYAVIAQHPDDTEDAVALFTTREQAERLAAQLTLDNGRNIDYTVEQAPVHENTDSYLASVAER